MREMEIHLTTSLNGTVLILFRNRDFSLLKHIDKTK